MLFIVCRSRSWAVYGVVVIRAEAGSLRHNEGVGGRGGVFLVVPRAGRGRRGRTVPLSRQVRSRPPWWRSPFLMLFRSNTPVFEGCPERFGSFAITKHDPGLKPDSN